MNIKAVSIVLAVGSAALFSSNVAVAAPSTIAGFGGVSCNLALSSNGFSPKSSNYSSMYQWGMGFFSAIAALEKNQPQAVRETFAGFSDAWFEMKAGEEGRIISSVKLFCQRNPNSKVLEGWKYAAELIAAGELR